MAGPRADRLPPALLAGLPAAGLHFSGALKSAPPVAALPFDPTVLFAAALAPGLLLLLAGRRWRALPLLAPPLACCAGLWLWLVVAGLWSPSRAVLAAKLPEAVLLAPAMLAAGLAIGADAPARRVLTDGTIALGVFVAAAVAWGISHGEVVLGGPTDGDPERVRVQYQLAGLAIACAAGLASVRAALSTGWRRAPWAAVVLALAAAQLLPGGRAALLGLGLAVVLAPAAAFWSAGRPRAALGWVGLAIVAGLGFAVVLADPDRISGLRTLERLTSEGIAASARPILWSQAVDWAGASAPWGLGTGGFTVAAGSGERRGLYPHNHALEALVEGGLPGLLLWLGAFGGGLAVLLARVRSMPPRAAGALVALVLPVAVAVMVSTDLGNRMAWFALGLALSPGLLADARWGETRDA
ncbi:O-antigen ligase family protein [Muricoccus radiodurans]|uniref:O-antigen ligase family protein n=1 Tax=Muricoccus radiodurans TaxID=2231721 RepID=UPI003CF5C8F7